MTANHAKMLLLTRLLSKTKRKTGNSLSLSLFFVPLLSLNAKVGDPSAPSSQTVAMNLEGMLPLRTDRETQGAMRQEKQWPPPSGRCPLLLVASCS